jgi:hypothetical protein
LTRIRATGTHARAGARELPVDQEVVVECLVVAEDVQEIVDVLTPLGHGDGCGDRLHEILLKSGLSRHAARE